MDKVKISFKKKPGVEIINFVVGIHYHCNTGNIGVRNYKGEVKCYSVKDIEAFEVQHFDKLNKSS